MSRWNRLGLQFRIMAYVTVGLLVLFSGLGYLNMLAVRDTRDQVFRERIALARSLAQNVQQDFAYLESDLRMGAETLSLPVEDFPLAAISLYRLQKRHAASQFFRVSAISILDEQGRLLVTGPAILRENPLPDPTKVQMAITQRRSAIIPSQGDAEEAAFVSVIVPVSAVWAGGKRVAVMADTVGVSGAMPAIPGGGTGYSVEIVSVDSMKIISASEPEVVGRQSPHYSLLQKYIKSGLDGVDIHREPRGTYVYKQVIAMTPLFSGAFYLVLEQPEDIAMTVPQKRWKELVIGGLAGMILMLGAAWYTTRRVVRPVGQLRAAARAFAQGSLDKPVHVVAQDELAELAEDIESMRRQLKRSRDDIEMARKELEKKVAERTQRLQEILGKTITAQEEERRRLARELHDEQSQALGALSVSLDRISHLVGPVSSAKTRSEIEQARDMSRSLLKETRRLIYDLRPSVLDDMGLQAAIRWCAETHLEQHGIKVNIHSSLSQKRLPNSIEVALFRVAQEAIVNIKRHSQARNASIVMEQKDSHLHMQVWDDGKGFIQSPGANGLETSGVGLEGMQERVRLIGGNMEIVSEAGKGTTIQVEVTVD